MATTEKVATEITSAEVDKAYEAADAALGDALDNTQLEDYDKVPEKLKTAISTHAQYATAQADEPTKSTVIESVSDTCKAIDDVQNAEAFFTKRPETLKDFKDKQVFLLREALSDLGSLVGAEAKNAKDNLVSRKDEVVDKTAKVVSTFKDATRFLQKQQELIEEETRSMRQSIEDSMNSINELVALAEKENNKELKGKLERSRQNIIEMSKTFAKMYETSQKHHPMFIPAKIHKCLTASNKVLKVTSKAITAYASMAKQAAKAKSTSLFMSIAGKLEKVTHKAKTFMSTLSDKLTQSVQKGKDFVMDLPNYRLAIVHDNPKTQHIEDLGKDFVSDCLAQGMTAKDITSGIARLQLDLDKNIHKELERPEVKKVLDVREQTATR